MINLPYMTKGKDFCRYNQGDKTVNCEIIKREIILRESHLFRQETCKRVKDSKGERLSPSV